MRKLTLKLRGSGYTVHYTVYSMCQSMMKKKNNNLEIFNQIRLSFICWQAGHYLTISIEYSKCR